jgi:septal ring factor EnvC (AmiA/AmiB activator)
MLKVKKNIKNKKVMENIEVLNKRFSLIFLMLIGIFIALIFSLLSSGNQIEKINYIKQEMAKNQIVIDSIYKANKKLDKQIVKLNSEIKILDNSIGANNDKIDKLKKDEKTQIDGFKHFDASMWQKYFTNRYSKK